MKGWKIEGVIGQILELKISTDSKALNQVAGDA